MAVIDVINKENENYVPYNKNKFYIIKVIGVVIVSACILGTIIGVYIAKNIYSEKIEESKIAKLEKQFIDAQNEYESRTTMENISSLLEDGKINLDNYLIDAYDYKIEIIREDDGYSGHTNATKKIIQINLNCIPYGNDIVLAKTLYHECWHACMYEKFDTNIDFLNAYNKKDALQREIDKFIENNGEYYLNKAELCAECFALYNIGDKDFKENYPLLYNKTKDFVEAEIL